MNETQLDKLYRFANDKILFKTVYEIILNNYLKPRPQASTEEKAAAFISIERLQDAWKELEKHGIAKEEEKSNLKQIGL